MVILLVIFAGVSSLVRFLPSRFFHFLHAYLAAFFQPSQVSFSPRVPESGRVRWKSWTLRLNVDDINMVTGSLSGRLIKFVP